MRWAALPAKLTRPASRRNMNTMPYEIIQNMTEELEYRKQVLFSVYGALVGEIIPSIRMITVKWDKKNILVTVYTHGDLSEREREDFEGSVATRIIADFPYPEKGESYARNWCTG